MRKLFAGALMVGALALGAPAALAADPPAADQSPIGGAGAHTHHVNTPSGCVDIDALMFEPLAFGLHRGANESGPDMGPWHGPC
jgi:hypothetical protein